MWPVGSAPFRALCLGKQRWGSLGLGGLGAGPPEHVVGGCQGEGVFGKRSPGQEPKPPPLPGCSQRHERRRQSLLAVLAHPLGRCLGAPPLQGRRGDPDGEGCWGLPSPLPQNAPSSVPRLWAGPGGRRLLPGPPFLPVQPESCPESKAFRQRAGPIWAAPFLLQEGEARGWRRVGVPRSSLHGAA